MPPLLVDAVIAAGFLVGGLGALAISQTFGWYPYDPASLVAVVVLGAHALMFGRQFPLPALIVVAVAVGWPLWWFDVPELRLLPVLLAGYRAAANGLRLAVALPITIVGTVFGLMPGFADTLAAAIQWGYNPISVYVDPSRRILTGIVVLAAVLLGAAANRPRRIAGELRRRNEELIRLQQVERERIAADERASIAREIHDVVAHHVSAMVIRAQAADRVADQRPDELRSAVRGIAADGRDALTAMRQVVRVLRPDEAQDAAAAASLTAALEQVAARVRDTGLTVESTIDVAEPLSEFEQATVLRIAQEAMTNVLLHSSATEVRLRVRVDDDAVHLDVRDNGTPRELIPAADGEPGGTGIRGMRERARSLGGTLSAGAADGGGWLVSAVLPYGQRELAT